jgi:hypothetical protein
MYEPRPKINKQSPLPTPIIPKPCNHYYMLLRTDPVEISTADTNVYLKPLRKFKHIFYCTKCLEMIMKTEES